MGAFGAMASIKEVAMGLFKVELSFYRHKYCNAKWGFQSFELVGGTPIPKFWFFYISSDGDCGVTYWKKGSLTSLGLS